MTIQKKQAQDEQVEYDTLHKVVSQDEKFTKRLQRYRKEQKSTA